MSVRNMITDSVNIRIAKSIDDAPNYTKEFKLVKAEKVIIVPKGTVEGNPTVDIQLTDANGNKYLVMATGNIIEMIGQTVTTTRQKSNTH